MRISFLALALIAGCSCGNEHVRDEDAGHAPDAAAPDASAIHVESCDALTDAELMAAVYGGPLVPAGFYDETFGLREGAQWREPCSASLDDTRAGAATAFGAGSLTGAERSTAQFHEVDVTSSGFTYHYRNTRCDYFDGTRLGIGLVNDPGPVKALADYLWFVELHDLGGSHVLAGIEHVGDATQRYDLCFVTTTYGDFGLCDHITLHTRALSASPGGQVTIEPDVDVRSIQGTCH